MKFFSEMKVSTKLLMSFGAVVMLSAVIGLYSVIQLGRVNQAAVDMNDDWLPSVRYILEIRGDAIRFRAQELQVVLSDNDKIAASFKKKMLVTQEELRKHQAEYIKHITTPEEGRLYEEFLGIWKQYGQEHDKIEALVDDNKADEARLMIRGESAKLSWDMEDRLARLVTLNVEGSTSANKAGQEAYQSSRFWVIVGLSASALLGTALGLGITRWLMKQLGGEPIYASMVAGEVASGNLMVAINVDQGDSSSLLFSMSEMRDSLVKIVTQVRAGTENIATASSQIASGNLELSARTEQQASSLEETASSMEEMTSTVKQNSDNARQANALVIAASDVATKGGSVISEVIDTMGAINDSAKKIVDIIGVIEGIAFQTNILALNAAVEAARAGEQGRGFAVVASEVRNLAQRAAGAAKEIKELIDDSVAKVEFGSKLVDQAGVTMNEIVGSVQKVTEIMSEISLASHEQSSGIEQINQAISDMDNVTQQNAALVEEAASAAASLQEQAAQLSKVVDVFQLAAERAAVPSRAASPKIEAVRSVARPVSVTKKGEGSTQRALRIANSSTDSFEEW